MNARILLTTFVLVAGLPLIGICDGAWSGSPSGDEKSLTRIYDVTTLNLPFYEEEGVEYLRLAPYAPGFLDEDQLGKEHYPIVTAETIEYLLYTIIGEETFEHDGIDMDSISDEKLVITGPESLHGFVSHILASVENHLNRRVTIDVEVYKAADKGSLKYGEAPSVRRAVEQGALSLILKQRCRTVPGGVSDFGSEKTQPIVVDYDNEIAQASVAYEPIVTEIATGLGISLRPFVSPDGRSLLVALHGLSSRTLESSAKRDIRITGRMATNNMVDVIRVSHTVDSPAMEFASVATVISLEPGKTAVVRTAFPHQQGLGSLVILLTAHNLSPVGALELANGLQLSCLDFGFLAAEYVLPVSFRKEGPFSEHNLLGRNPEEDCAYTSLGQRRRMVPKRMEEIFERTIKECVPPDSDYVMRGDSFQYGDSRCFLLGNLVVMRARQDFADLLAHDALEMFESGFSPLDVTIQFVETTGSAVLTDVNEILENGRLVGVLSTPMVSGGRTATIAGLEGFMIYGYDVDVANQSSCPNPRIRRYLDGVFARLVHRPSSNDAGIVEAEFYVNKLSGPIASCHLGENGGMLGVIDQPRFDHGLFQTRIRVDGDFHVVGTVSGERGGETATLYIIASSSAN